MFQTARNRLFSLRNISTNVRKPFFITTPIFYVNASPHIGHLYSALIADVVFRFENILKPHDRNVFSTGTDEHGMKIQQAADAKKVPVNVYCDQISADYDKLFRSTNIGFTDFIRTTEPRHAKAVAKFWSRLQASGNIYLSEYEGWYCVSDESFLTESQLTEVNGKKVSLSSGHPVEWMTETNYMFRLSNYQDRVIEWVQHCSPIRPKVFEKILLDLLKEPLGDISVSRPSSRVPWGIPVPDDASQTVYVWLDALVNYLTCAGYPKAEFQDSWPADIQVLGKDILKFHGVYWPAFLLAAGFEPPRQLLVHSHWTVDGQKMSKSKFNVVDPAERAIEYTSDGLRYFLLREGVFHSDGNYSETKVLRILNSELADTFGNLLSRGCSKALNPKQKIPRIHRSKFDELANEDATKRLIEIIEKTPEKCLRHYQSYNFNMAIDQVMALLHAGNNFFEKSKPWELKNGNESEIERLETIIAISFEVLRVSCVILNPIIPTITGKLFEKLNVHSENRQWSSLQTLCWNKKDSVEDKLNVGNAILFRRILPPKMAELSRAG